MLCCGAVARCASYDAHLATAQQNIPTQHDMLPQHLVCKYELNCEYCNITLARNKAPFWWNDKIETCRSVLKCFKVFYVKLYVHSLVHKLKWFYETSRCYIKIYRLFLLNFYGAEKKHMNTMHYKKWLEVKHAALQTKTIMKHGRAALKFKFWVNRESRKGSWNYNF